MKNWLLVGLWAAILLTVCLCLIQGASTISEETARLDWHLLMDRKPAYVSTEIKYCTLGGLFLQPLGPGSGGGQPPRPN